MILAYGGASDVRSIQFYRTVSPTLYVPFNFIVRRPRRCTFHLILSYIANLWRNWKAASAWKNGWHKAAISPL